MPRQKVQLHVQCLCICREPLETRVYAHVCVHRQRHADSKNGLPRCHCRRRFWNRKDPGFEFSLSYMSYVTLRVLGILLGSSGACF